VDLGRRQKKPVELGATWDVESYERGRPPYPAEAIDLLVSELGVDPAATVLDLGAGNGRLTRALVGRFARVIAVEPHAEMRARLAARSPQAEVLDGAAEAIPLAAESIDAVLVGSAFHWFDMTRAVPEIARVLRPRGGLGIIASRWARDTSEWATEIDRVLNRHGSDPAAGWRDRFAATHGFEPLAEALLIADQEADRAGVLARVASISFIAALAEPERRQVLREVEQILDTHPETRTAATLGTPHRIEICWTHKR
jgi:SAM-dependent methyltransferase